MNKANIAQRFALLCGIDTSEAEAWLPLIEDACDAVRARLRRELSGEADRRRAEALCAAYAYRLYCLSGSSGITAFSAGEVHVTSSAGGSDRAEKLWQRLIAESGDLIESDGFIFGRVIE